MVPRTLFSSSQCLAGVHLWSSRYSSRVCSTPRNCLTYLNGLVFSHFDPSYYIKNSNPMIHLLCNYYSFFYFFNTMFYLKVVYFLNKCLFDSPECPNKPLPFIPLHIPSWELNYPNASYRSLYFFPQHCFPCLCYCYLRFSLIFFCHQDHILHFFKL